MFMFQTAPWFHFKIELVQQNGKWNEWAKPLAGCYWQKGQKGQGLRQPPVVMLEAMLKKYKFDKKGIEKQRCQNWSRFVYEYGGEKYVLHSSCERSDSHCKLLFLSYTHSFSPL